MVDGHIDVKSDKQDLVDSLRSKIDEAPNRASDMVSDLLDIYSGFSRDESPVKWGNLQNSVTAELITPFEGIVYPDIYYAPYVIEGTPPHIIEATNADALGPFIFSSYMGTNIGGHVGEKGAKAMGNSGLSFFKRVHHPGTAPNDFMNRAYNNADGMVTARTQEFLDWFVE